MWHAKAEGKTAIDYAFHLIVTDMPQERVGEMTQPRRPGRHQLQAVHGVSGRAAVDDGTIFSAMRKAGEDGTLVCMHAENGIVIDDTGEDRACARATSHPNITR